MKSFLKYILFFCFHQYSFGQELSVEIFNYSGYDLDSIMIEEIFIGSIKLDSSKTVKNIGILKIQDEKPFGTPKANIMNKKKGADLFYCGTGVEFVKSGKYQFDILLVEYESGYQLTWRKHIHE